MLMPRRRAEELLKLFPQQRILVVGDLMLDRYVIGKVHRISPEAPVPVLHVVEEKAVPGGSANVAWNIVALGGQASVAGVVGNDEAGRELAAMLKKQGITIGSAFENIAHRTTVKTRIIAERQQMARVDWEERFAYTDDLFAAFRQHLETEIQQATGIVLADYGKGVLQQPIVDTVIAGGLKRGIPVSFDPKDFDLRVDGITFATPNRKEAFAASGVPETKPEEYPIEDQMLLHVGRKLMDKWNPKELIITLGAQGMMLLSRDRPPLHVPTRAREVFDVSGAGDTVIATCTLALAAGASFDEAAELANWAAGVVVGKVGTATCSARELLQYIQPASGA